MSKFKVKGKKMTSKKALKIYENIRKNYLELGGTISIDVFQAQKKLTDLVERDTPKKVILDTERVKETYLCPNCKKAECTIYNDFGDDWQLNYCDNCGQRLDWGELKSE